MFMSRVFEIGQGLRRRWRDRAMAGDLVALAEHFGTDKWGAHRYAPHYQQHFASRRHDVRTILEIGVGGYENPRRGGQSLRMWKRFFPRALVVGLDLHDKRALEEPRIRIFQGRQDDREVLLRIVGETGAPDIVIDDGSHRSADVIATFDVLFPVLKENGVYVVEDTQTSYWPSFGGHTSDRNSPQTTMGFLKGLLDGLNHSEYLVPGYVSSYYDRHIVSVHAYHNLVFVYKGVNDEGSNLVRDGRFV
jgi:hypothetical protein